MASTLPLLIKPSSAPGGAAITSNVSPAVHAPDEIRTHAGHHGQLVSGRPLVFRTDLFQHSPDGAGREDLQLGRACRAAAQAHGAARMPQAKPGRATSFETSGPRERIRQWFTVRIVRRIVCEGNAWRARCYTTSTSPAPSNTASTMRRNTASPISGETSRRRALPRPQERADRTSD